MTYNTTREQTRRRKPTLAQRAAIESSCASPPRDKSGKFARKVAA